MQYDYPTFQEKAVIDNKIYIIYMKIPYSVLKESLKTSLYRNSAISLIYGIQHSRHTM